MNIHEAKGEVLPVAMAAVCSTAVILLFVCCCSHSRPPLQLLHCIKSELCYEEEGPVSYE